MMFEPQLWLLFVWSAVCLLSGGWVFKPRYLGRSLTLRMLPRGGIYTTLSEPTWRQEGKREGYFATIALPTGGVRLLYCGYYVPPPRWTVRGFIWRRWEAVVTPPTTA